ncbi:hypothetical protein [Streptomyces sp. NPDC059874]|uniref:hypothetical protein n=1 Tax=Streptomyces sp. NPDC059874 TaxID=3346983 RepID=UPI0036635396
MEYPAVSLGVGAAAQAAASLINTHRRLKAEEQARASRQDFEKVQAEARFGRELQLEDVRQKRLTRIAELESRLRRDTDLAALRNRRLIDSYPVEEGPGHLRESLRLLSSDLTTLPLVVLLPTFHGSPEGHWAGLRGSVIDALRRRLAADGLIELQDSLRTLASPHAAFYWNDLYGIPTLVVQVRYFRDTLDISLGGCHLRAGAESPAEGLRSIYRHRIARPDRGTPQAVAELNASVPASHRLAVPADDTERVRVDIEIAARAATAVVTAAVDAYYLGNSARYRQRLDEAAAALGAGALADWEPDLGIALWQVADPAFHLLTVATRQARRRQGEAAVASLRHSLAILTHPDYAVTGPPFPPVADAAEPLAAADSLYRTAFRQALSEAATAVTGVPGATDSASRQDLDEMAGVLHD